MFRNQVRPNFDAFIPELILCHSDRASLYTPLDVTCVF